MKNSGAVSRPVRIEDAEDLQRNILSRNTVEEVKDRIDFYLGCYNKGIGIQIIAEIDGEAIASLELKKKNHPLYKHRAELFSLVVNPKHQRKGIARMLVKNAAEYAKEIGVEILEVGCRGGTPAEEKGKPEETQIHLM